MCTCVCMMHSRVCAHVHVSVFVFCVVLSSENVLVQAVCPSLAHLDSTMGCLPCQQTQLQLSEARWNAGSIPSFSAFSLKPAHTQSLIHNRCPWYVQTGSPWVPYAVVCIVVRVGCFRSLHCDWILMICMRVLCVL